MSIESLPISLDPSFEVVPPELQDQVEAEVRTASDYVKLGIILGAGFIGWRALVKNSMPELTEPSSSTIRQALTGVIDQTGPSWLRATVPALERAYEIGSHGGLDQAEINYLATVYAKEMESYVHETSANALLEGFNALVNRKWSPQIAYRRALEGFGLTSDGMKTYIMSMENLNTDYLPNSLTEDPRVNSVLTKLLGQRAVSIGENEAYTVQEMGRQIMWMRAAEEGLIPKDSRRLWRTAKDEKVCSLCGPMNEEVVGLYDKFNVAGQEYWNPALHPNCRCWVELIEPEELAKAYDPMRTPRGGNAKNKGQFSRSWGPKAQVKSKDIDPIVDQIIADALKAPKEKEGNSSVTSDLFANPFAGASPFVNPFTGSDLFADVFANSADISSAADIPSAAVIPAAFTLQQEKRAATAALSSGASLPEAMTVYFKALDLGRPPWETFGPPAPSEPNPRVMYGFAIKPEYLGSDSGAREIVDFSTGSSEFTVFSGDLGRHLFDAQNAWADYRTALSVHISEDLEYRNYWRQKYLEPALSVALGSYSDNELNNMAEDLKVYVMPGEDAATPLMNLFTKSVTGATPVDPMVNHVLFNTPNEGERPNYLKNGVEAAYMKAADELIGTSAESLDGADYDRHTRAIDRVSKIFADRVEYPVDLSSILALPTIFEVADPDALISTNKEGHFNLDGQYLVDRVSLDPMGSDWGFPWVQNVTLIPINSVSKTMDPFGVVHLGVK